MAQNTEKPTSPIEIVSAESLEHPTGNIAKLIAEFHVREIISKQHGNIARNGLVDELHKLRLR